MQMERACDGTNNKGLKSPTEPSRTLKLLVGGMRSKTSDVLSP